MQPSLCIVALALLTPVTPVPGADSPRIVRTDTHSERVFVVREAFTPRVTEANRAYMNRLVSAVSAAHPEWGERWSASFFTSEQAAGYKDEPTILPQVNAGTWSESYVAEYTHAGRRLVLYPLIPKRLSVITFPTK